MILRNENFSAGRDVLAIFPYHVFWVLEGQEKGSGRENFGNPVSLPFIISKESQ